MAASRGRQTERFTWFIVNRNPAPWNLERVLVAEAFERTTSFKSATQLHDLFDVYIIIEGNLNSKLPTIWTVEKQSRVVKSAERRCNSAKVRRKKIHPRQMLEKSRNAVFFQ